MELRVTYLRRPLAASGAAGRNVKTKARRCFVFIIKASARIQAEVERASPRRAIPDIQGPGVLLCNMFVGSRDGFIRPVPDLQVPSTRALQQPGARPESGGRRERMCVFGGWSSCRRSFVVRGALVLFVRKQQVQALLRYSYCQHFPTRVVSGNVTFCR